MTKVALCTPICGPPSWHYHFDVCDFQAWHYLNRPDVSIIRPRLSRPMPIDVARNALVQITLSSGADWMWMVDQDAAFKPQTLDRLMSWNLPIVSALEMMRLPEACWPMALKETRADGKHNILAPEVYSYIGQWHDYRSNAPAILDPRPPNSLLEVGFAGCHCLLVQRDVLLQMEQPWFQGYDPGGEDEYFCKKAKEQLGITVCVDLSVLVGHATTDRVIGAYDFMAHHYWEASLKEHGDNGNNEASPECRREPRADAAAICEVGEGVA